MAEFNIQNVIAFLHGDNAANCGAVGFVVGMVAEKVIIFLHGDTAANYGVVGFVIVMAVAVVGLYFTDGGKKYLRGRWSVMVFYFLVAIAIALLMAWRNRHQCRIWIARAPAWMKTIRTGVILILVTLVCYIGEGSVGGILFFMAASFSILGLLPLLRNDLGLVDFFIGGAINTTVVKFNLGIWTWTIIAFCIVIVHLRNEFEQRVAIPAATIEMRRDEEVELETQTPQIEVPVSASIEMRRDGDVELQIQAPQIEPGSSPTNSGGGAAMVASGGGDGATAPTTVEDSNDEHGLRPF